MPYLSTFWPVCCSIYHIRYARFVGRISYYLSHGLLSAVISHLSSVHVCQKNWYGQLIGLVKEPAGNTQIYTHTHPSATQSHVALTSLMFLTSQRFFSLSTKLIFLDCLHELIVTVCPLFSLPFYIELCKSSKCLYTTLLIYLYLFKSAVPG